MPKFFVKNEQVKDSYIEIINDDFNHIKNVLRLNKGDYIQIGNSDTGENYKSKIEEIKSDIIKCKIEQKIKETTESNVEIHIYQGLPKADKMELIIQKCTELGVKKIIPVSMKRSIVKLSGKDEKKKIERWQKIAEAASKQSGRDKILQVENILDFKDITDMIENYDAFIVTYEKEEINTLKNELIKLKCIENPKIAVLIGPEGGIDLKEIEILKTKNAKIITLGKRILRTETVAFVVSGIINYELEN